METVPISTTSPFGLVVDDNPAWRAALAGRLEDEGFSTETAGSLAEARAALATRTYDLVLVDILLPDGNGLELAGELEPSLPTVVVFVTGHATVDTAVQAFRDGAVDYLTKPVDLRRLKSIAANVRRTRELRDEIRTLRTELRELGRFGELIGGSEAMQKVYGLIEHVAATDSTVLVLGETGTGKELVAETIHRLSPRARRAFVPINCAAVSVHLIESELFGHEKGSFTGAERMRKGLFERADGGTVFLDEIAEMPMELQVKLLRVLETRKVVRVGGDDPISVDVRVVAATNRDPHEAVKLGHLREDLLYRLLVFPIRLPPLRERRDDIDQLVQHFITAHNTRIGSRKRMTTAAVDYLQLRPWPGNVRELKHVVERAYILAGDQIGLECFDADDDGSAVAASSVTALPFPAGARESTSLAEAEKRVILDALASCGGSKKRAAEALGVSLKTLYNRLKRYESS